MMSYGQAERPVESPETAAAKAHTTCPWTLTIPEVTPPPFFYMNQGVTPCWSPSSPHPVNLKCDSEMRTPTLANYSNISRNTPILLAFFEWFGTPFPSQQALPLGPQGSMDRSMAFKGALASRVALSRRPSDQSLTGNRRKPAWIPGATGEHRWNPWDSLGILGQWEGRWLLVMVLWEDNNFGCSFVLYPNPHGSPKNISNWSTQTEHIVWNYEQFGNVRNVGSPIFKKDRQFQVDASLKNQVHRLNIELASIKAIDLYYKSF